MNRLAIAIALAFFASSVGASTPSIEDFSREPDTRDMELSPDGRHLAIIYTVGDKRSVVVRNIETPDMPVVGIFEQDLVRPNYLYWGSNDRLLIAMTAPYNFKKVLRDKEKKDDFDINDYPAYSRMIAVDADMSNPIILMEGERRLGYNRSLSRISHFLPDDPEHILMPAFRDGGRIQFRVNIVNGDVEVAARGSARTIQFLNDETGSPRYRIDYLPRSKALEIFEFADQRRWTKLDRIYLDNDDEDSFDTDGLVAISEESLVYRKRNDQTGFYELLLVTPESGDEEVLVSLPDQDVFGAILDHRTDEVVGYATEEDVVRAVFFDGERQETYDRVARLIGNYNFRVYGDSARHNKSLIYTWGPDDSGSFYLWNNSSSELMLLARKHQGLAPGRLSHPAVTTYQSRDGESIRAYLLLPQDFQADQSFPTVLLPHGGPHIRDRMNFDALAQFLSTRGYIVVQPNFRGSSGYGREFLEAGYKQWGGLMQDDLTDAIAHLVEKGYTDPDRVCIVGASYGGYAALMGAAKTPNTFRCAISMNGVTHLRKWIQYTMKERVDKEYWKEVLFDKIGHPETDKAILDANSPVLIADSIKVPVLLIAGKEDQIVPFDQSRIMAKALRKAGTEYEFIRLDDTGHNPIYYTEDIDIVFPAIERFLRENLN